MPIRGAGLAAVAAASSLIAVCGCGSPGTSGGAPAPTPTPAATPLAAHAFLHVLARERDTIDSYEVSPETGRLRAVAATAAAAASVIGAAPGAGMLYTWARSKGAPLRSYFVDRSTGTPSLASDLAWNEWPSFDAYLDLSSDRVFAWSSYSYPHLSNVLAGYERRQDGGWARGTTPPLPKWDTFDLYTCPVSQRVFMTLGGAVVYTFVPGATGEFEQEGPRLALEDVTQTGFSAPVDAQGGGAVVGEHLVLNVGALASFRVIDGRLRGEVLTPDDLWQWGDWDARPLWLVAGPDGTLAEMPDPRRARVFTTKTGARLFRIDDSGALTVTGNVPAPIRGGAAFHPSGGFFYVFTEGGLTTYRLEHGSWTPFAFDPGVPPGDIVVTTG